MRESYTLEKVDIQTLYKTMLEKQRAGYRLCQICATAFEGYNEIIYSVVKEYTFENYKIELPIDDEITTISDFYPSAMLYENEMKELFGVKIKSINIDYDNKFYRIKAKTPFKKEVKDAIKIVKTDDTSKEESLDSGKIVNDMSKCIAVFAQENARQPVSQLTEQAKRLGQSTVTIASVVVPALMLA